MIIHERKGKAKGPLGILRKSIAGRIHDAVTAQDNKSNNNGRALGLNQRALNFCFDKCEAHISRFTVIYFFFQKRNK